MDAKIVFAFIGLVFVAVQPTAAQTGNRSLPFTIAPIVLPGGGLDTCPSIQEREAARNNITSTVRDLLPSILPGSPVPQCGEGNWVQIANLDMSDSSQQCPPQWREVSTPARSCGRPDTRRGSCDSVNYSVLESQYSRVCGRMTGYIISTSDAFGFSLHNPQQTIDEIYVDGISVTYGSPRNHVWTSAAGHGSSNQEFRCPCGNPDRNAAPLPPSFVGDNYYCDSGLNGALWDGEDCTTSCCTFNTPPWFSVQLPTSTTDDIEVRICSDQLVAGEDSPIAFLQLYVQ